MFVFSSIVEKDSYFRIFNDELIDIWKVRKYISTVNNEIKLIVTTTLYNLELLGTSKTNLQFIQVMNKCQDLIN